MALPVFTAADYLASFLAMLPRGRAWPRDADTIMVQQLAKLTPTWARLDARAQNLIVDGFPSTTVEMLPEWEASLGLPDPCAGESPTLQARRAQVVARFIGQGGQSIPYFIAFAAALGYSITTTEYAPFRAGYSRAGDPVNGQDWAFALAFNAPLNTITWFSAGLSAAGEPLAAWGNAVLECELRRIAPAHTVPLFDYS